MVSDAPKLDTRIKTDEQLFFAAMTDTTFLRDEYISALSAVEKAAQNDFELQRQRERLDRARSRLSQAMTVMDLARGDSVG